MKTLRICRLGHKYYKSSDCSVCTECEKLKRPGSGFLSLLSAPARRALENEGIKTLKQLSQCSEKELMLLHGFGKSSLPKLRLALKGQALSFRK